MSEEKSLVVTDMGEKKNVKDITFAGLSDCFDHHMRFVKAINMLVNDCSMGIDGLDSHTHLSAVLSEVEDRLGYIQAIGDEMYRRLCDVKEEKAA
ncbi:MAG: hypothetical protein PHT96_05485 [Syntrophorhabdaceae bacterium]|nr:hypothetical protein [Syntrophorhabdaceae bacterium]